MSAKSEINSAADYPGVFVELIPNIGSDDEAEMLACVEYDSAKGRLQTLSYQPGAESPQEIVIHRVDRSGSYVCTVTETLKRTVVIKANSEAEALDSLKSLYYGEKIILTADDYVDTDFSCKIATKDQDLTPYTHYTHKDCFEDDKEEI